jgi:hypothetical protein
MPPGTADLLIKFVPPETLERFGGAGRYARAIDDSLTRLGAMLRENLSSISLRASDDSALRTIFFSKSARMALATADTPSEISVARREKDSGPMKVAAILPSR